MSFSFFVKRKENKMQATVLNINELSTMFPMVSLRVRIIELKDAEPNNLSNGQVIRDNKGQPTQKLQMIVRDATGGVRITFWKVTEEAVRAFRVGTCALFFNVKVARAQSPKYSDYHWISVNADPTGSTPSTFQVLADDASLPSSIPMKVIEPTSVRSEYGAFESPARASANSGISPHSTPIKREREEEKCPVCDLSIVQHEFCPRQTGKVSHKSKVCPLCSLNMTDFVTCSKTGEAHACKKTGEKGGEEKGVKTGEKGSGKKGEKGGDMSF